VLRREALDSAQREEKDIRISSCTLWLVVFFSVLAVASRAKAQSIPASPATQQEQDALDNPVLEQADEEQLIPYIKSRVTLKYDRLRADDGGTVNQGRLYWLQAFGETQRFGTSIELPLLGVNPAAGNAGATGFGDMKVAFRAMISKSQKFEQAAEAEFTFPTAGSKVLGFNETVYRTAWGFSREITKDFLLSGNLSYNKTIQSRNVPQLTNFLEPELILSHDFTKHVAAYVDWDTFYDFTVSQYGQIMKLGAVWVIDRPGKWNLEPYVQFPLNEFTRRVDFKNDVGIDVTYHF
jgi:hypothetical protein